MSAAAISRWDHSGVASPISVAGAVILTIAVTLAAPAVAQVDPGSGASLRDLSLEQLGSIEVTTVSKQPATLWRSPAAVFVLTSDDIRRSGATTLPELLRLVPGLQVSRLDSNHWAVGVRGLASAFSKSLLVLIDGRSVYTPLFGGVFWQVQDTLLEDIERIEVIRGPGGTIWGANAVNGVINVITRNSRDTTGRLATLGGGSADQGRAALRYGGRRGDNLHYRVYASGAIRSAEHHTDDMPFDDWRIGQAGFRVDTTSQRDAYVLQGDVYTGAAGDSVVAGSFSPPARVILTGDDQVFGANMLGRWERRFDGGADTRLQAYIDYTERDAAHFGESRTTFDIDFLHRTTLARRHNVSWGAGVRVSPSDFTTVVPTLTLSPEDRTHRVLSAFAQDEMAVAERLWLTVGAKFEHNNYSGLEIQPTVAVLWRPDDRQSAWASVTRAVRTPARIDTDLQLTGFASAEPLIYVQVRGTRDFRAERLIGIGAGYRRLLGASLYVDVAAFHNDYDDLAGFGAFAITAETEPVPHILFALPYENAIEGTTSGIEISPDWQAARWLRVKGAYSLLSADMALRPGYTDEANVALYEGSSPRHQGFVQASLTLPGRLELDHTYRFVSRLPSHDVPRYVTADARLGWRLSEAMSVALTGRNLLQSDHVEFFRDDIAPIGIRRSVFASITWQR